MLHEIHPCHFKFQTCPEIYAAYFNIPFGQIIIFLPDLFIDVGDRESSGDGGVPLCGEVHPVVENWEGRICADSFLNRQLTFK